MTGTGHLLVMAKTPVGGRVKTRLESFTAAGGRVLVCTPCAKTRGVDLEHLIGGATPGGGVGLVEFMTTEGAAASVSY